LFTLPWSPGFRKPALNSSHSHNVSKTLPVNADLGLIGIFNPPIKGATIVYAPYLTPVKLNSKTFPKKSASLATNGKKKPSWLAINPPGLAFSKD